MAMWSVMMISLAPCGTASRIAGMTIRDDARSLRIIYVTRIE